MSRAPYKATQTKGGIDMYGHIYIRHGGVAVIYKANDYYTIYDALMNMGYDHEEAEEIANWAESHTTRLHGNCTTAATRLKGDLYHGR